MASSLANNSCEQKNDGSDTIKDSKASLPTFTPEQYEKLLALIQGNSQDQHAMLTTHQGSSSSQHGHTPAEGSKSGMVFTFSCHNSSVNGSWIIDSRASDHICSSLHWFQHYSEIKPINVRLPNGHISIAKYSGTVIFLLVLR